MKSRELHTTPVVVVSDYQISPHADGRFLHTFRPASTNTPYQFIANREPILEEGARYNFGYVVEHGINWVDTSAIAKADNVDPESSFHVARVLGEEIREVETRKSNERVVHKANDGRYLGRKYAWRIYGMAVPRDVFDSYLVHIKHPSVPCVTDGTTSIAYREDGLYGAVDALRRSLVRIEGNRFKSHLIPTKRWFQVKGISAITDKK